MNVKYTILLLAGFIFCCTTNGFAQNKTETVTGTVSNAQTGDPLVGVNILVVGTTTGTVTDIEGHYSLSVSSLQDTLRFSYIGYQTKTVPIDGRTAINILLQPTVLSGQKVVVVGYSKKRQSQLTAGVTTINSKKLKGITSPNLSEMLSGRVPGLVASGARGRPGNGNHLIIHGRGSIGAGSSPLVVVDGIIGGSYDPNDIASVTVLKDAAATALYGSRAANGVIVITTKKGQPGKTKVTYDGSFGFTKMHKGHLRMMNAKELYALQKMGYKNFYDERVEAGDPNFTNTSFDQYLQSVLPHSLLDTQTDWQSLLSRTGYVNNQHLAVSGGGEKTTFYVSGNYYRQLGNILSVYYRKMDFRLNLEHQMFNWLTLRTSISGGSVKHPNEPLGGQRGVMSQYYNNMPWDPAFNADGMPYNPKAPGHHYISNAHANFFYNKEHQKDITKNAHLTTDIRVNAEITDWLRFSSRNRIGLSGNNRTILFDRHHPHASFLGGELTQNYRYHKFFLTSNLVYLKHSFGANNFSAILGQEYNTKLNSNTRAVGVDIPEGLSALGAAGSPRVISGRQVKIKFLSYFGEIDYNYKNRYFVKGSVRKDGSSLFGSNNRWATFYAVGGAWMISNENFLTDATWIDELKLRLSYGTTGNANIPPYQSLGTYTFSNASRYNGVGGTRPARLPNPNLTWETEYMSDIGLNLSMFNRLKLKVTVYNKVNKNLLQKVPLPATRGFSSVRRNVGSVRNRGVDLRVKSINLNEKQLRWETTLSFSLNRNKVVSLNGHEDISKRFIRIREGLPLNYFYMKKWAGVDPKTGKALWFRWENANGDLINGSNREKPEKIVKTTNYNEASNLFIASAYPDFTGGIRNHFFYKNFSLSILCNFVKGQKIFNFARRRRDSDGNSLNQNQRKLMPGWSRWEKPGDIVTHPEYISGGGSSSNRPSSRFLEDGGYLRIKNIRLDYTFPLNTSFFSSLRLYISLDNVAVFTKFSGSDPGVSLGNPIVNQNSGNAAYSSTRKFILGLHIEF